jgi:2-iminobutanoate/2-iminopropanoate deaminase
MARNNGDAPVYNYAPGSQVASSVWVPAGCHTVYLPGMAAWKPGDSLQNDFGDTAAQTAATFERIRGELGNLGLGLSDIVMLRVTLVADPKMGDKVDFAGYTRVYQRYFGTAEQPHKPARATYEGKLVIPNLLVEIEAIAATRRG